MAIVKASDYTNLKAEILAELRNTETKGTDDGSTGRRYLEGNTGITTLVDTEFSNIIDKNERDALIAPLEDDVYFIGQDEVTKDFKSDIIKSTNLVGLQELSNFITLLASYTAVELPYPNGGMSGDQPLYDAEQKAQITNCVGACTGMCLDSCTSTCSTDCTGGCLSDCTGTCQTTCTGTCTGSCTGTCAGSCTTTCGSSCSSGNCTGSCSSSCARNCSTSCDEGDCYGRCTGGCSNTCTGGCNTTCTGDCDGTAKCTSCKTTACATSCSGGCSTGCTSCRGTCNATCAGVGAPYK